MPETESGALAAEKTAPAALSTTGDGLVSRSGEAAQMARVLLDARGGLTVIHGRRGSGKSELIRRWLIPAFPEGEIVCYGKCAPELPETVESREGELALDDALGRPCFLFLDNFDRLLLLPSAAGNQSFGRIFQTARVATLVLVVSDENLGEMLALRSLAPGLLENMLEVKGIPLREGLERLSSEPGGSHCAYSPEVISALEEQLERFRSKERGRDPNLLKVIDSLVPSLLGPESGGVFRKADYERAGELRGILRRHLDSRIEELSSSRNSAAAGDVALAILEEAVLGQRLGSELDLDEIACRLDADPAACRETLEWLAGPGGLMRESWTGALELAPAQLEQVIEERLEWKSGESQHAQITVEKGLRTWKDLRVLLPLDLFREVHRRRANLRVNQEAVAFLVRCALRHAEDTGVEAARHWLARLRERSARVKTLLEALYDERFVVRRCAAALLRDFDEPEVRTQLYRAALEDQDASVRRESASSLDVMNKEELWELLVLEARQAANPHRQSAVEALRIFRDERTARVLGDLVGDSGTSPEIRVSAIATLGASEHSAAARTLLEIALTDKDDDDRRNAAETLAAIGSEELASEVLLALRTSRRTVEEGPGGAAGFGALWRIARRVLFVLLFLVVGLGSLFTIHGLAHLLVKRYRAMFVIIGYQLLGVLCYLLYTLDDEYLRVFAFTHLQDFYLWIGAALFVGTWVWDVAWVGFQYVLFPGRRLARQRHSAIYECVLANPHYARGVLSETESANLGVRKWAKSLVKTFGHVLPPALCIELFKSRRGQVPRAFIHALERTGRDESVSGIRLLWPDASPSMRARIVGILARRAGAESGESLRKLWPQFGQLARIRYRWIVFLRRLRMIPLMLWLVLIITASLAVEATPVFMDWSELAYRYVQSTKAIDEMPVRVVHTAEFLVKEFPEQSGRKVPQQLGRILHRLGVRAATLDAIGLLANVAGDPTRKEMAADGRKALAENGETLRRFLFDPALQPADKRKVIKALEVVGDDKAVEALKKFGLSGSDLPSADDPRLIEQTARAREAERELRLDAILALGRMETPVAAEVFDKLADDRDLRRKLTQLDSVSTRTIAASYQREAERLRSEKKLKEALATIEKALKVDPRFPEAHGTQGLILLDQKDSQRALNAFSQATKVEPRYAWAYSMQAWILTGRKEYEKAADFALKAVAADPGLSLSYSLLADTYHQRGQDREAIAHLEKLRKQYPTEFGPLNAEMYIYHEYLSRSDPSAYRLNYELYEAIMKLGDKSEETEAGFIEANFTTGRFDAAVRRGEGLLKTTQKDNLRLPVSVIVHAAYVLRGDSRSALAALDQLEKLLKALPKDADLSWSYAGTLNFLNTCNSQKTCTISEWHRLPLVGLVRAISADPKAVPGIILEVQRNALKNAR